MLLDAILKVQAVAAANQVYINSKSVSAKGFKECSIYQGYNNIRYSTTRFYSTKKKLQSDTY